MKVARCDVVRTRLHPKDQLDAGVGLEGFGETGQLAESHDVGVKGTEIAV